MFELEPISGVIQPKQFHLVWPAEFFVHWVPPCDTNVGVKFSERIWRIGPVIVGGPRGFGDCLADAEVLARERLGIHVAAHSRGKQDEAFCIKDASDEVGLQAHEQGRDGDRFQVRIDLQLGRRTGLWPRPHAL